MESLNASKRDGYCFNDDWTETSSFLLRSVKPSAHHLGWSLSSSSFFLALIKLLLLESKLTFVHLLNNWAKLVTVPCDCWLHLLELTLADGVLSWNRVVVLPVSRDVHSVDIFHNQLLLFCIMLFRIWILCLLNVLDRGCLFALYIEGWWASWLPSAV